MDRINYGTFKVFSGHLVLNSVHNISNRGIYASFLQNVTRNDFGFWETHKVPGSTIGTEPPCTSSSFASGAIHGETFRSRN